MSLKKWTKTSEIIDRYFGVLDDGTSAENIDEILSRTAPGDFGESPASIQCFRELTKNDVW